MGLTVALPKELEAVLNTMSSDVLKHTQEVRLRIGCPLTLSLPKEEMVLNEYVCTGERLDSVFQYLCEYSVHSHQEELRHGYIRTKSGCRVGVTGTAVTEHGRVVSLRNITSLCIRLRHEHKNCAEQLMPLILDDEGPHSALICGEPASGKTSLLCDIARSLSLGCHTKRPFRVSVVDERGEIILPNDVPCDVLLGYPKASGIEQAVRTMAPEFVLFDELGDVCEVRAVLSCLNSGVCSISTIHARNPDELKKRETGQAALRSGAFEYVIFLRGREYPGEISQVVLVDEII